MGESAAALGFGGNNSLVGFLAAAGIRAVAEAKLQRFEGEERTQGRTGPPGS